MRVKHLVIVVLVFFVIDVTAVQAQPGGGGDPGGGEPVPLQGLWILIAAGVAVAVKNLWSKKSNS